MANRYETALTVQDASNFGAIARALVSAIDEAKKDPDYTGEEYVRNDHAVFLIMDKLYGMVGNSSVTNRYGVAYTVCQRFRTHDYCGGHCNGGIHRA